MKKIEFSRVWAMPNANTFSIKPIKDLIAVEFSRLPKMGCAVDPFVRNSPFKSKCHSNDLDPAINADECMDALDFLKGIRSGVVDLLLFDPPYSPRQVSEHYKRLGQTVNMETTQASFWGNLKKEAARIIKPGGRVVSCGWGSGGIGKTAGFEIVKILLVPHGGAHNDTIIVVEEKS